MAKPPLLCSRRGRGFSRPLRTLLTLASLISGISTGLPAWAEGRLADEEVGAPFRIRDFTFPGFLVLGFAPMPAAPLGRGNWAIELHGSVVNDFQVSDAVEEYLAARPGPRRGLDATDAAAILALPEGDAFYIDGEFNFFDFALYYGLTERLDFGLALYSIGYTGGSLDESIFDFHDRFGYGQQGRNYVSDDRFQVVFGADELDPVVSLERPAAGGWSDPSLYLRYGFPLRSNGWRYGLVFGLKPPLADDTDFLSTGSWDFGAELTAEKRWRQNAFIFNIAMVAPGTFRRSRFEPPLLPSIHLSFIHRLRRLPNTRVMIQALLAEHPFRELVDSDLTRLETQLTVAIKWNTPMGVFGLGLTENLLNMDNTPDIGLHFSWGLLMAKPAAPKPPATPDPP